MLIYILKTRRYHTCNGCCDVDVFAYKTLSEALKKLITFVSEHEADVENWSENGCTTGEYIVDISGYGKTGVDNICITLELVKVKES